MAQFWPDLADLESAVAAEECGGNGNGEEQDGGRSHHLSREARHLQQVVRRIRALGMDQAEYTYFKALLLLRPGKRAN